VSQLFHAASVILVVQLVVTDHTDLKEKPVQIESAGLVVSDSVLVEQRYQQLISSSTHKEIQASVPNPFRSLYMVRLSRLGGITSSVCLHAITR
jgi:hypothetical protein